MVLTFLKTGLMISWAEQMYLESTDFRQNLSQCKKMMKSQNHLTQTYWIIYFCSGEWMVNKLPQDQPKKKLNTTLIF